MIQKQNNLTRIDQLLSDGKPTFGVFDRVEHINYLDYHSYKLSGKPVSQWRKKLRANQFCFVQVVQHPYRVCVAVATLNWVTSSFCYFYNSETDEFELVEALQPFTRQTQFNESTYHNEIRFKSGKLSIAMSFDKDSMQLTIDSNILTLSATLNRPYAPLSVCTPTGKNGWTYTQKEPMITVLGDLQIGEKNLSLAGATANLDWSLGYMRRVTNWWWACITDYLTDGRHFGLNLATGVNETGASENACWVDGTRYHLPAVLFTRMKLDNNRHSQTEVWHISNQSLNWSKVSIALTFTPVHCYKKSDRLLVVDSVFEQWVGYYSGTIDLGNGTLIQLDNIMGLAEDHYAKW